MDIAERYKKSLGALTAEQLETLRLKKVCVAGCGGLGGYVVELLARIGVLSITVVDGDTFAESNLNRQLLCTEQNLGRLKAEEAAVRVKAVNSSVDIIVKSVYLNEQNASEILRGHDVIIDALDNVNSRLLLEKTAEKLFIPIVHGAMQDWIAQLAVIRPGDRTLERFYGTFVPPEPSVPTFTPAFCAALMAAETVKLLCGVKTLDSGRILVFDLYDFCMDSVKIDAV